MLSMSVHSYRGGTGKTLLATNLAAVYSRGEKTCLLDYDLRAPSLHNIFKGQRPRYWINDYLNGDCEIDDCLHEVKPNYYACFACPDAEALRDLMAKSSGWERDALRRTLAMRPRLEELGFRKTIFDTSPGLAYSSINAIVGSDVVALVMRLDSLDIVGTSEMIRGVYELLEKPTFIVVNMVLPPQREALGPTMEKSFKNTLAYIPCLCDVRGLLAQGKEIMIDEKFEYSATVNRLAEDINRLYCK